MDPETLKVVTSRDVVFDEISSYYVQPILTSIDDSSSEGYEDVQVSTGPLSLSKSNFVPHDPSGRESDASHETNDK